MALGLDAGAMAEVLKECGEAEPQIGADPKGFWRGRVSRRECGVHIVRDIHACASETLRVWSASTLTVMSAGARIP